MAYATWNPKLYDDKHAFVWQQAAGLLDLLAPQSGERILDVGCGTGHLAVQIAKTGAKVVGLDASQEMIAQALLSYPQVEFLIDDARWLPFNQEFDAVFSNATLHWIPDAGLVVESIARALKPGGRFVAEFGGKGNIRHVVHAMAEAALAVTGKRLPNPWYFPSIAEYASLLERHDLEVTSATLFDRPTRLEGADGMRKWIEMFGGPYLTAIDPKDQEEFLQTAEKLARPELLHDGVWLADYRRLRVVAWKRA